jgi:hypothetical protein
MVKILNRKHELVTTFPSLAAFLCLRLKTTEKILVTNKWVLKSDLAQRPNGASIFVHKSCKENLTLLGCMGDNPAKSGLSPIPGDTTATCVKL